MAAQQLLTEGKLTIPAVPVSTGIAVPTQVPQPGLIQAQQFSASSSAIPSSSSSSSSSSTPSPAPAINIMPPHQVQQQMLAASSVVVPQQPVSVPTPPPVGIQQVQVQLQRAGTPNLPPTSQTPTPPTLMDQSQGNALSIQLKATSSYSPSTKNPLLVLNC